MDINKIREKYRNVRNEIMGSSEEERGKRAAYSDFLCISYEIRSIEEIKKLLQEFIETEDKDEDLFTSSLQNAVKDILADVRRIKC